MMTPALQFLAVAALLAACGSGALESSSAQGLQEGANSDPSAPGAPGATGDLPETADGDASVSGSDPQNGPPSPAEGERPEVSDRPGQAPTGGTAAMPAGGEAEDPNGGAPEPPVEQPDPPSEQPDPPSEQPDPPSEQPDPPSEQPDPPSEQPEPPVEEPDPPAEEPAADPRFRRRLPDTTDRVHVFYDQLHNRLTDAQYAFAATHADGTQKVTRSVSDRIRAVNPEFVVLQYRLAFGLSAEHNITTENLWDRDTIEPNDAANAGDPRQTDESFYLHVPAGSNNRVQHEDNYWLADVRNPAWQSHVIDELMRRMPLNDFDGVFLDTAHVRWDGLSPDTWWRDFCGPDYGALPSCWTDPARAYYEDMVARFHSGPIWSYAVGNFGPLITDVDDNAYLEPLDGGMIEHFMMLGGYPNEHDWHLTAERITRLIGNDKILIAEPMYFDRNDRMIRRWLIGNFMLFKGRQSFAAFYPSGTGHVEGPIWLPEYDLDLGRPQAPVPDDIAPFCTGATAAFSCAGLYVRAYERGFVVVNPSGGGRETNLPALPAGERYAEVDFEGGGYVGVDGVPAAQRLIYTPMDGVRVATAAHDARLIVRIGADGQPVR